MDDKGIKAAILRAEAKLTALASLDSRLQKCVDEQQLTLLNAIRELIVADVPPLKILPLVDMWSNLARPNGKRRRKLRDRLELAMLAAAVTVLKKGRTVDAAIAEVATLNGSSRKDLKNFRDRLNRGLADCNSMNLYKLGLRIFEEMTKAEMIAHLARLTARV